MHGHVTQEALERLRTSVQRVGKLYLRPGTKVVIQLSPNAVYVEVIQDGSQNVEPFYDAVHQEILRFYDDPEGYQPVAMH